MIHEKINEMLIKVFRKWSSDTKGDFPGGSDGKESACNARDPGSIPGLGRSPEEGTDKPLQYSWENSMDKGAWRAIFHWLTKSQT